MKYFSMLTALSLSLLVYNTSSTAQSEDPVIEDSYFEDSYFGEKAPGLKPELFASDIVSVTGRGDFGISFSPKLDEMYFSAQPKEGPASIFFSLIKDKKWQPLQKANFTEGKKAGEMEPFVRADGKRIYFTGYDEGFKNEEIWYVDRKDNGWSKAVKLNSELNNDYVMNLTQAKNGDVYYDNISKRKMYFSTYKDGNFIEAKEVDAQIGSHAFISSSQDYLLVQAQNQEDKNRNSDIYVYFKQNNGSWTKPINLGPNVNSSFHERVPSVTPDGKYLFFSRYNEEGGFANLYWVSTQVIENVRPKQL